MRALAATGVCVAAAVAEGVREKDVVGVPEGPGADGHEAVPGLGAGTSVTPRYT